MSRTLGCPNAVQDKITDPIMCKLGGGCSHQHPCWMISGIALSHGHYSCPGRNKKPKKIYPKSVSRKKRRQLEEKEKRKNN